MKVGEYARVRMEHVKVNMSNNFEFIFELRYKLENLWENEIKGDEMEMIWWQNEKDG